MAKLRGRYNRTPLHATISHTMTLTTAARRICWRFWQHTGPVMTTPVFTALLSASESPQACQAPAVLVSIGPTAGLNKKFSLKTTSFAFSEGYRLCRVFGVYRNFFIPVTYRERSRVGKTPHHIPRRGRVGVPHPVRPGLVPLRGNRGVEKAKGGHRRGRSEEAQGALHLELPHGLGRFDGPCRIYNPQDVKFRRW